MRIHTPFRRFKLSRNAAPSRGGETRCRYYHGIVVWSLDENLKAGAASRGRMKSIDTGDAVRVSLSEILLSIDRALGVGAPTSNGDVLQAIAMAMSVRARMKTSSRLAMELLSTALTAAGVAARQAPPTGHA
jgi:hypothetical protein